MADETFDPSDATVEEINTYLEDADPAERERVLEVESSASTPRKGVVEGPYASDNSGEERTDQSGRVLHDWEVSPEDQVGPANAPDES